MIALLIGIVFIAFAILAAWPGLWLSWLDQVIVVLQGGIPLFALFIGLITVLIGIADIKDRIEVKREEKAEAKNSDASQGSTETNTEAK